MHPSPKDKATVLSAAFDHSANNLARALEDRVRAQQGVPLSTARAIVARRLNVLPGTLENLRRGRIKDVRQRIADRLHAAYIRELERDFAALTHELHCLRQTGSRLDSGEMAEVAADLAKIRTLLKRGNTGEP